MHEKKKDFELHDLHADSLYTMKKNKFTKRFKLDSHSVYAIIQLVSEGKIPTIEIAQRFNITPQTVFLVVKGSIWGHVFSEYRAKARERLEQNKQRSIDEKCKITANDKINIREQYAAGASTDELAKAFQISKTRVRIILRG